LPFEGSYNVTRLIGLLHKSIQPNKKKKKMSCEAILWSEGGKSSELYLLLNLQYGDKCMKNMKVYE